MSSVKEVHKGWGKERWMVNTDLYCGKKLFLKKGSKCSLHFHKIKDETFYIDSGQVLMETYENDIAPFLNEDVSYNPVGKEMIMNIGDVVRIRPGTKHRFTGLEDSVIIEISTHHEDSDSYRIKDNEK